MKDPVLTDRRKSTTEPLTTQARKPAPPHAPADIREAIERIERSIAGMSFAAFAHDEKTIDAVVRNMEIMGEAARRLPDEFTDEHSKIE
jgi:hypothetical protein